MKQSMSFLFGLVLFFVLTITALAITQPMQEQKKDSFSTCVALPIIQPGKFQKPSSLHRTDFVV